ncbi:MAG: hypothetical protein CVU39_00980 [Chloroflexi bacterium HGW-Chloroflexi-10]|nr:MAG: hypothetical protein CVU39_00980 [Chloroflexi bacterium HGW-Chloroflexi-10]
MNHQNRWLGYDWFKLIVVVILLFLLFNSLWNTPPIPITGGMVNAPQADSQPVRLPTIIPTSTSTQRSDDMPTNRTIDSSTSETNGWVIEATTITPVSLSINSSTPQAALLAPQQPTPTAANTPEPAPVSISLQAAVTCPASMPSRISVGNRVRLTSNLNLRTAGSLNASLILTNPANTMLTIIDGPLCEELSGGAYLWWMVQMADDTQGWSVEATLDGSTYYMEPLP